jgi:hypothetical protein
MVASGEESIFKSLSMFPIGTTLKRVILPIEKTTGGEGSVLRAEEIIIDSRDSILASHVIWSSHRTVRSLSVLEMKEGRIVQSGKIFSFDGKIILNYSNLSVSASGATLDGSTRSINLLPPCKIVFTQEGAAKESTVLRRFDKIATAPQSNFVDLQYIYPLAEKIDQYYFLIQPEKKSGFYRKMTILTQSDTLVDKLHEAVILKGPSVLKDSNMSICCRGGFVFRFDHDDQEPVVAKTDSFSKFRSFRGLGGTTAVATNKKQETSTLRSSEVLFTTLTRSCRFSGDAPSIRSERGVLRASQQDQFFTINSKGNLILGPGIWRFDQDIEEIPMN